jgi:predicted RNA-binding protein with PUA-like domain
MGRRQNPRRVKLLAWNIRRIEPCDVEGLSENTCGCSKKERNDPDPDNCAEAPNKRFAIVGVDCFVLSINTVVSIQNLRELMMVASKHIASEATRLAVLPGFVITSTVWLSEVTFDRPVESFK